MTIDARSIRSVSPRPPRRKATGGRVVLGLLIGAAIISVTIAVGSQGSSSGSNGAGAAAQQAVRAGPAPILHEPYDPYTRSEDPDIYARWGRSGMARINRLRIAAAEGVAKNASCDEVQLADLADDLSSKSKKPIVYVDCTNTQRFYVAEADIGRPIISETEKGARWNEADAVSACTEAVRSRLNIPASMSRDLFDTSAFQAATTGRWVVDFGFKARNGLGFKIPASAHCILMTDGRPEVQIHSK